MAKATKSLTGKQRTETRHISRESVQVALSSVVDSYLQSSNQSLFHNVVLRTLLQVLERQRNIISTTSTATATEHVNHHYPNAVSWYGDVIRKLSSDRPSSYVVARWRFGTHAPSVDQSLRNDRQPVAVNITIVVSSESHASSVTNSSSSSSSSGSCNSRRRVSQSRRLEQIREHTASCNKLFCNGAEKCALEPSH
ncbi:hypothetical protein NP493_364g00008 [Ridgeia piscesae]|uniref:Uncharacterized protein n=1 Tax=Ridgeia piscesae TaxID=27915 RepID=A0AAD9NVB4_RIDPI|nr:hypothetical protein NP493_364g00008 [Ridgeia piscesae]